jgi:hypothetical protein
MIIMIPEDENPDAPQQVFIRDGAGNGWLLEDKDNGFALSLDAATFGGFQIEALPVAMNKVEVRHHDNG